jgi:hypothetical protein
MAFQAPEDADLRGPVTDDYIYLCGYPPIDDFLSFIRNNQTDGQPVNTRPLTEEWRAGNDHVRALEGTEGELAATGVILPLQENLEPLRDQVLADPVVRRTFDVMPIDVGMVELDRLSVFQKHVNLSYVHDLRAILGQNPSDEAVFRYCLLDPPQPTVKFAKVAANGYVFVSPSNDLRFLGPALLEPSQVTGYPLPGRASGVVGLVAGFGANCLSVMAFEGRLILNNGTHRAAALRQAGMTHAPAIIQHISRREELEAVFSSDVLEKVEVYLEMARPPLFKDYFDPKLSRPVKVPRRLTQVKLTFGWESIDVPVV